MRTLEALRALGIKKISLKSSITRKFLNKKEIEEIKNNHNFLLLFNLMSSKENKITNCLKYKRDFWFNGTKIDISPLAFLVK